MTRNCTRCRQECENLHYCGTQRSHDYHLHPACGVPMEIKSKHRSHNAHRLVAVCRETLARCDACGREQKGRFFSCHTCDFWLHVDCAVLPRFVKCTKHRHPLVLSYSIYEYAYDALSKCIICEEKIFEGGAYLCGECKGYAHLRCVADYIEDLGTETIIVILDLPYEDLDALWSWMRKKLQKMRLDVGKPTFDYNYRPDHNLLLCDRGVHSRDNITEPQNISQESACCNVCIQPIFPPFYACPQSQSDQGRDFHLHQECSEILARASSPMQKPKESLCSLFYCRFCGIPSNGLIYYFASNIKDISCLCAPRFVKHDSHRQHVLYHFDVRYRYDKRKTLNCCSTPDMYWYAYACVDCSFAIHVHCALLPKRIEHRFDVHPLNLITTSVMMNEDMIATDCSDYFCEFCEEDIDTRFWYYGCEECNNLFHIKCIPSVGYLSRVKFGNSIVVPCHSHAVTFVRMLGYGSQKCGFCEGIIRGLVDDMAFHCSECDFWMHFGCAEKCSGTEKFDPGERTIR